jgi:hypothetical protein
VQCRSSDERGAIGVFGAGHSLFRSGDVMTPACVLAVRR